jgi:hypothetical protein
MGYRFLKRHVHTSREMHTMLREFFIYSLGWTEVDNDPGAGSFGLLASGSSGIVTNTEPQRFTTGANNFTPSMVGMWLVTHSTTVAGNTGIFRIGQYIDPQTIECEQGLYEPNFTDESPIQYRVVDPSLNLGTNWFVVQNANGTQVRVFMTAALDRVFYEVAPFGGWDSVGDAWTGPVTSNAWIIEGTEQIWTWFGREAPDNTHVVGVSDDDVNTVREIAYIGEIDAYHHAVDPVPAICLGGTPDMTNGGFLGGSRGGQIAADDLTARDVVGLEFGDGGGGTFEFFTSLEPNPWDGFWDEADVAVSSIAGADSENRGVLYDVRICSTLLRRRESLNNGRTRISLGTGISILGDGDPLA